MSASPDMTAYYARRAQEYEKIYAKPERQADLAALRARLPELLAGRRIYEVACGTGYWTQTIAPAAAAVFATDYNEEVLAIARTKPLPPGRVTFARADAFKPPLPPRPCDAGLAAFWWSHLRRGEQTASFLRAFFARLRPHASFVFLDNRFVAGSSTPLARTDGDGNTFQQRRLADGTTHEVLKNFPTEAEVRAALEAHAARIVWEQSDYYWLAWGELP
jgi:demethylmenaquinone methyltransferase/2-methoxy-6-polyprenyl-1,4-benzoquinol methylase